MYERIRRFAADYKLWLAIPLAVVAISAFKSVDLAFGLMAFFALLGGIGLLIKGALWFTDKVVFKNTSDAARSELQDATGITLFLIICAAIGSVMGSQNAFSDFVTDRVTGEMNFGFIHPGFAILCIICVWVYTMVRLSKLR